MRTDLRPPVQIQAHVRYVSGTKRRTTLGQPPGQVALVEHVLAALAGLRIDNCIVEVNAGEPPGLDGSARCFVEVLRQAGSRLQPARRPVYGVRAPVMVSEHGATLALHPAETDSLKVSYILNYGHTAPIVPQISTCTIRPDSFANEVSSCRTFLLDAEAAELRRQGLGTRTTAADLLVFGRHGPIDNSLRYGNEPARHKILDIVGDLSLLGHDLVGHVVAYRSGHPLNIELVRRLTEQLGGARMPLQEIAA